MLNLIIQVFLVTKTSLITLRTIKLALLENASNMIKEVYLTLKYDILEKILEILVTRVIRQKNILYALTQASRNVLSFRLLAGCLVYINVENENYPRVRR